MSFLSSIMKKQKILEEVVCGLNSETKLPKHQILIPEKDRIPDGPKFYCCDSRRNECNNCLIYENKPYCNYTP